MNHARVITIHSRVNMQRVYHRDPHAIERATDCFIEMLPAKPTMCSRELHRIYTGNDTSRLVTYESWMRPEFAGILCVRTENVTGGLIRLHAGKNTDLYSVSRQLRGGEMIVWNVHDYDFRMSTLEALIPGDGESYADFISYFSSVNMR